ncbi:MAG: septum formation initiator family protein [Wenzhouxiangellaceae bacterium]|nr:septum formation initiator family protein [Wenzhouxiangellaceae bacterium]
MRLIIVGLILLLIVLQVQVWQQYARVDELEQRVAEQQDYNRGLAERNRALLAEVNDLRAGLDAVEERARAELGLIGPDEEFYLVVDPEDLSESDRAALDARRASEPPPPSTAESGG